MTTHRRRSAALAARSGETSDESSISNLARRLASAVVRLSALERSERVAEALADAQRYKSLLLEAARGTDDAPRLGLAVREFLRRIEDLLDASGAAGSGGSRKRLIARRDADVLRFEVSEAQLGELARDVLAGRPVRAPFLELPIGAPPHRVEVECPASGEPLRLSATPFGPPSERGVYLVCDPLGDYENGRMLALAADAEARSSAADEEGSPRSVRRPRLSRAASGTVRLGRYEVLERIASGAMGTVYRGRVVGAGGFERTLAIKVMHEHIASDPEFERMFLDEARLAARIHHPNVVSTLDVQQTGEAMFLVMEYIDGPSLRRLRQLVGTRRMPLGVVVRIVADALAGLHAAHELRGPDGEPVHLVHRDVSPHNIVVGSDGVSRITDFGVARADTRLTHSSAHTIKGKVSYMAPEQGAGARLDRRADVYAAGIVLWELLAGERLFQAESDVDALRKMLEGARRGPREVNPAVPASLDAVCMRALSFEPDGRYDTAIAFADALESAAKAEGVEVASARDVARFVEAAQAGELPDEAPPRPAPEPERPSTTAPPPLRETLPEGAVKRAASRRGRRLMIVALFVAVAAAAFAVASADGGASEALVTALLTRARAVLDSIIP